MFTTLNEILLHDPCESGWRELLLGLGKTKADDEELPFIEILKHVGIRDSIWCLRVLGHGHEDTRLFKADVAESVLHLYINQYPNDDRPKRAIEAVRSGSAATWADDAASDAARAARARAARAATACAATAAATDARAAACAATAAGYVGCGAGACASAAVDAAGYAGYAGYAVDAAGYVDAREKKWAEIESLFIKHFGCK
jgi:hypothetical protein